MIPYNACILHITAGTGPELSDVLFLKYSQNFFL